MEDILLSKIKIKKIKNLKLREDFISDQCKYFLFLNDTIYDIKNKLAFNFNSEKILLAIIFICGLRIRKIRYFHWDFYMIIMILFHYGMKKHMI